MYIPVGITWFLTGFIQDNETLLSILKRLTAISVLGPFYMHWYAFASYLWAWSDN